MNLSNIKHEDDRRIIFDWAQGDFKSAKVVLIKEEIAVGDHHHNKKDEHFFLIKGSFKEIVLGDTIINNINAPHIINVPRGTYHKFICTAGSILLGVATEVYNQEDEIKK